MTIEEVLNAEGYTPEESKELIENPKHSKLLTKILKQSEEGQTALLKAQELEKNIREFNDNTVIPYGAKKDAEAAEARAEAAKYQTYLKTLKDAGYDIPDAYLGAAPEPAAVAAKVEPRYAAAEDLDRQGRAYMSLLSVAERARDLLGHGVDIESEYDSMKKDGRPGETFRDYVDRKYDLSAKAKAKADEKLAAERKSIADAAIEEYKKAHPQTDNEDLRIPAASKFDKFNSLPDEKKNSWQTREGREASTIARQEKYRQFLVQ